MSVATIALVISGCSTGTAIIEGQTVTATAETVGEKGATEAARKLWHTVSAEVRSETAQTPEDVKPRIDLGVHVAGLRFVDAFGCLIRRHGVSVVKPYSQFRLSGSHRPDPVDGGADHAVGGVATTTMSLCLERFEPNSLAVTGPVSVCGRGDDHRCLVGCPIGPTGPFGSNSPGGITYSARASGGSTGRAKRESGRCRGDRTKPA